MHRALRRLMIRVGLIGLTSLAACQSPWERHYDGVAAPPAVLPEEVSIRSVPWETLTTTRKSLEQRAARSDIHPDDWPAEEREAAHAELLRGLRVSADPRSIDMLGRSEFRSTDPLRPERDSALRDFASEIGATRIVWSSAYLGKTDVVVEEPITTYTYGEHWFRDAHTGRFRSHTFRGESTTWVPVVVERDETWWVAYFLRDR